MTKLDRMVKQAALRQPRIPSMAQKILFPAAGATLAAGVTMGILPAMQKSKLKKERELAWEHIKAINPELAKAKGTKDNFEAMHDITPRMMKHPSFAIPILRQARDYDSEGIPVNLLQIATSAEHGSGGFKNKADVYRNLMAGAQIGQGIL